MTWRSGRRSRTYGGAMLATPESGTSLRARTGQHRAAKSAIAEAALAVIAEGETMTMDGDPTVEALGRRLKGRQQRVIRNNLCCLAVLADALGMDPVRLGGAVRLISMSTTGLLAEMVLKGCAAQIT